MSRPFNQALKYIRLDVDIHNNKKVEKMELRHGDAGFTFIVKLWCRVFSDSYYLELDDDVVASFCRKILYKQVEEFDVLLKSAIEFRIFDKKIYDSYRILTSDAIQERYLDITKRWGRVVICPEYIIDKQILGPYKLFICNRAGHIIEQKTPIKIPKSTDQKPKKDKVEPGHKETKEKTVIPENFEETITDVHYKNPKLETDILSFWGFNQISQKTHHILLVHFLTSLNNLGQLDYFIKQFECYKEYKELSNTVTHRFDNFLGKQELQFNDGKWKSANWEHELEEEKKKSGKKINGSHQPISKVKQGLNSHENFIKNYVNKNE